MKRALAVLAMCALTNAALAASAPVKLRCNYLTDPLGLDDLRPALGWQMVSGTSGASQTAYRVIVSSTEDAISSNRGDMWDTRKIESSLSVGIEYAGKTLTSRTKCYWKVMTWDNEGNPSPWSAPAFWSMGLLNGSDWAAKWIGPGKEDPPQKPKTENRKLFEKASWVWFPFTGDIRKAPRETRYFKKAFSIAGNVKEGNLVMRCDADFDCKINGERVLISNAERSLNPEVDQFFVASPAAVSAALKRGRNVIEVKAANKKGATAGLIGALSVTSSDGGTIIVTDGTWQTDKTADGPFAAKAQVIGEFGCGPWRNLEIRNRAPVTYVRKEFILKSEPLSANLYVTGLGACKIFMNGNRAERVAAYTIVRQFDKQIPYSTYDVTDTLSAGKNTVGVILGGVHYPRFAGKGRRLLFQMEITYKDGSREQFISDDSWKGTSRGPIVYSEEFEGECYDARKEFPAWHTNGFDDSGWSAVALSPPRRPRRAPENFVAPLTSANIMPPMRVTGTMKPVKIHNPARGVYVFDMGQNFTGRPVLKVRGPAGATVTMRKSEILDENNNIDKRAYRGARCTDTYTLKGQGEEVYRPAFSFGGFRYIEMTGFPGTPSLDNLSAEIIGTDLPMSGDFVSSNHTLNQLIRCARWGIRSNYFSIPTDCPQRDERKGWLGDRSAEQLGESYLFDNVTLYRKWLGDIRGDQTENGRVPEVSPFHGGQGGPGTDMLWPSALAIVPGSLYSMYADRRALEDNYPAIRKWFAMQDNRLNEKGLSTSVHWGDWCALGGRTSKEIMASCYFYNNKLITAGYADAIGKKADAADLRRQALELKDAINTHLYNSERGQYQTGSQTSQILPLAFGIAEGDARQAAAKRLLDTFGSEVKRQCGLIGGQWLFRGLDRSGRGDIAYRLLTQRTLPSYGYMFDNGATTIWERWDANITKSNMNSRNHVMNLGDSIIWTFETLAGIKPDEQQPGFKHIIMQPKVFGDLTFVKAHYDSVYGRIESNWKLDGDTFVWNVTIPANTTADVYVPDKNASSYRMPAGTRARFLRADATIRDKLNMSRAVLRISSGSHTFTSSLK